MASRASLDGLNRKTLGDIFEWDVGCWKQALDVWGPAAGDLSAKRVLDIGARHGGLSLYFALRGCEVVCTDRDGPSDQARERHARHGVADRVTYETVDAATLPYDDESFDVVCFKSVLGGIGLDDNYPNQQRAIGQIHRVLKPGGKLLFAENMKGSPLHRAFRWLFVRWGRRWRYVTGAELRDLLSPFSDVTLRRYGFFSAFGRAEWQRSMFHGLDVVVGPLVPPGWRYVTFGCATK